MSRDEASRLAAVLGQIMQRLESAERRVDALTAARIMERPPARPATPGSAS
jgi:hypothetical protein